MDSKQMIDSLRAMVSGDRSSAIDFPTKEFLSKVADRLEELEQQVNAVEEDRTGRE